MRQLRFVRLAEDAAHLVLESADGTEQFALPNDGAVRAAVGAPHTPASGPGRRLSESGSGQLGPEAGPEATAALPAAAPPAPAPPAVEIAPREIQIRVRSGESPEDLAESLGVEVERVQRFARPVIEERRRIAGEARRGRARRSTPEGAENAAVVFGEAVDDRFTAHGIAPADVSWDSHRREDGDWVVAASWLGGEGRHTAEWVFSRVSRTVTPIDETASDLLSDRPIRPVVPKAEPARPSLAAAPPLAPGVVAFPPMADANTGPLPRYEEVFDQEAAPDVPRDVPPFVPATAEVELDFDAPPLPLGITDASTRPDAAGVPAHSSLASLTTLNRAKREEPDEDRAARARVPSWDDILLGVRRKQD